MKSHKEIMSHVKKCSDELHGETACLTMRYMNACKMFNLRKRSDTAGCKQCLFAMISTKHSDSETIEILELIDNGSEARNQAIPGVTEA
jgi:hypothetical protein